MLVSLIVAAITEPHTTKSFPKNDHNHQVMVHNGIPNNVNANVVDKAASKFELPGDEVVLMRRCLCGISFPYLA